MGDGELGFAIVGCGVISALHARALAEVDGARLVAVADVVPERARRLGEEHSVPWAADPSEVIQRDDVDAVCACVPSGLHAEIGIMAAGAGKHVVVEKPIDVSLEAADRLIGACEKAGVQLAVISQRRFDDDVQRLRRMIDEGRLGRLLLGEAAVKWYRSQAYYDSEDWRGTLALDGGGALINQGIHYLDLLRWLMGPVESVVARTDTASHDMEGEDVALALLRFRNGALGVVQASTAVYPGLAWRVEIAGTGGTVVLENSAITVEGLKEEDEVTPARGSREKRTPPNPTETAAANPAAIAHEGHRRQLTDFVDSIRDHRPPLVTGAEARHSLEVVDAIYRSARSGHPVELS